jgi:hypothetical protein
VDGFGTEFTVEDLLNGGSHCDYRLAILFLELKQFPTCYGAALPKIESK